MVQARRQNPTNKRVIRAARLKQATRKANSRTKWIKPKPIFLMPFWKRRGKKQVIEKIRKKTTKRTRITTAKNKRLKRITIDLIDRKRGPRVALCPRRFKAKNTLVLRKSGIQKSALHKKWCDKTAGCSFESK